MEGRKNNCKLNLFSMYFVQNNKEICLSFKNSEKQQTQALSLPTEESDIKGKWYAFRAV